MNTHHVHVYMHVHVYTCACSERGTCVSELDCPSGPGWNVGPTQPTINSNCACSTPSADTATSDGSAYSIEV